MIHFYSNYLPSLSSFALMRELLRQRETRIYNFHSRLLNSYPPVWRYRCRRSLTKFFSSFPLLNVTAVKISSLDFPPYIEEIIGKNPDTLKIDKKDIRAFYHTLVSIINRRDTPFKCPLPTLCKKCTPSWYNLEVSVIDAYTKKLSDISANENPDDILFLLDIRDLLTHVEDVQ